MAKMYFDDDADLDVLAGKTVGVIGYGNIGGRLAPRLAELDLRLLVNDPPLAGTNPEFARPYESCSLQEILSRSDIVTLHVPLTRGGKFPTRRLIGDAEAKLMKQGAWLINTSRGGVVAELRLINNRGSLRHQALGVLRRNRLDSGVEGFQNLSFVFVAERFNQLGKGFRFRLFKARGMKQEPRLAPAMVPCASVTGINRTRRFRHSEMFL